eukprot:5231390-Pleurochrysis_carterae.AAC.7
MCVIACQRGGYRPLLRARVRGMRALACVCVRSRLPCARMRSRAFACVRACRALACARVRSRAFACVRARSRLPHCGRPHPAGHREGEVLELLEHLAVGLAVLEHGDQLADADVGEPRVRELEPCKLAQPVRARRRVGVTRVVCKVVERRVGDVGARERQAAERCQLEERRDAAVGETVEARQVERRERRALRDGAHADVAHRRPRDVDRVQR